jgi:3-oxoacyl-[acyl-carrier-protein] synthase III
VAVLRAFGAYLPARVISNQELGSKLNRTPDWILDVSGIEERRYAAEDESVADMAVAAATQCLERAGLTAGDIGMFIVSSGSAERRFPGPASAVASRLGAISAPALDVPMASAGGLFGMALAAQMAAVYGNILVVAAEKMSAVVTREPMEQGVAILFGDGAGACVISRGEAPDRIVDSVLHSDGSFAEDLRLEFDAPLAMNGRSVIMQASRKIPGAIAELLERNRTPASAVKIFLMHQANQNLIDRVAKALDVPAEMFYSNIRGYGNTSSASMLIAASEWWRAPGACPGDLVCFAAFGAGFHWGAVLVQA